MIKIQSILENNHTLEASTDLEKQIWEKWCELNREYHTIKTQASEQKKPKIRSDRYHSE